MFASVKQLPIITVIFLILAAFKHYTCFWLVLHTSALEFSLLGMVSNVVIFLLRRLVFREDGAPFGYGTFPVWEMMTTVVGFTLISVCASSTAGDHSVLADPATADGKSIPLPGPNDRSSSEQEQAPTGPV
jgi:hypothetical protein